MSLSLRQGTVWMVAGQSAYALCQWVGIIILARLGGAGEVGVYALALAVTTPLMIFSHLQMRQVLVTDAAECYPFGDYAIVRFSTTLLALLATALVAWLGDYDRGTAIVIVIVGVAKAFESLSDLFYGLEQRRSRFDLVGQSLALRGLAGLVAFAAAYLFTGRLLVAAGALAGAWAMVCLLFDYRVTTGWRREQKAKAPRGFGAQRVQTCIGLAWLGLPLGVTVMLGSLNTNIPRYFIDAYLGSAGLGIFAALGHFLVAGNLVVVALGQTVSARLANRFAAGELGAFRSLLARLLLFSTLIGFGGVMVALTLGEPILKAVYGGPFAARSEIFVWMMLLGMISYPASALGFGLTAMRMFRTPAVVVAIAVAINLTGCYLLVPHYGLIGAIAAWSIALLCQALLFAHAVGRGLRLSPAGKGSKTRSHTRVPGER